MLYSILLIINNTLPSSLARLTSFLFIHLLLMIIICSRLPHIRIRKPNTDVCEICLWYRARPMDEGKAIHLGHVKTQRDALNSTIRDSRLPLFSHTVQLTFGFAERVLLPMFADTPTDIYFKAGLKVDLFGVDNTTQVQTNYVLPEGKWPGEKGVNAIASMLYRDVVANHADKTTIHYMADISSGQNKSRFMIWFLSFLSTTLNKTFHLRFLIAGHSKNFRDACFGLCKRSLKGKNVFTPNDVVNCYDSSGRCNTVATASGAVFYDWRTFLDQFYSGTIDYISKMHEFRFTPDEPGIVSYKRFHISSSGDGAGDWMAQRLWRKSVYAQSLCDPTGAGLRPLSSFVVPPSTYSLESRIVYPGLTRKQYLQREIVDHYFVGERAGHASLYFEDGSSTPEETPP